MNQQITKPVSVNSTGYKPFYYVAKTAKTMDDFKFSNELTQGEKLKRHWIFRCLIAELRAERFEPDENNEFSYRVFELPKLNYSRNFDELDETDLDRRGVCPIPNLTLNALICEKLAKRFGDLSVCGCFYKIDDAWRLDVSEHLSRNGLFEAMRSHWNGLIYGLKVFRYADDRRPFMLKTRGAK